MRQAVTTPRFPRIRVIVARLCLVISLWQAPIPWIHRHGTDCEPAATAATFDMTRHLSVFHANCAAAADEEYGWHFHWVLPSWSHPLDNTPDDEPPARELVAFDQATIADVESVALDEQAAWSVGGGHHDAARALVARRPDASLASDNAMRQRPRQISFLTTSPRALRC